MLFIYLSKGNWFCFLNAQLGPAAP